MSDSDSLTLVDDPVIAYVLVRVDAPDFNIGKACAQTHHCGTQMTEDLLRKEDTELETLYKEWQEDRTFGTVLTVAVNASELRQAVSLAQLMGLHSAITHDPTYPIRDGDKFILSPVDTCGYVFGRKSICHKVVGKFNLLSQKEITKQQIG